MRSYTIRPGDTLSGISQRFNTTVQRLAQANHIANPNVILAGAKLHIPDRYESKPKPAPSAHQAHVAHVQHQANVTRAPKSVAAKYELYKQKILAAGGKFRSEPGRMNLVGFRTNTNTHANGGQGRYDDKLVAVWRDRQGRPHVREYTYNTEPAYAMRAYSADVTGDGVADQGRVPAGYHEYAQSSWKHGFCLRATRDFSVERDFNHDGRFTEKRRTGGGASMLFHQGGSYSTGSAGCQTLSPAEWAKFTRDVRNTGGVIGYTLIQR